MAALESVTTTTEIDRVTQAARGLLPENFKIAAGQILAEATYRSLAEALSQHGIDHILLKGPHLGALAYDEAWERPYCDLDVLVGPEQFFNAVKTLEDAGFARTEAPEGRLATEESYYNWALRSAVGWVVELHRELAGFGQFVVDHEALFARAVDFRFGQTVARGLSLEDLLVHLVIHAAKGHFRDMGAKHVEDVARLVTRQPVGWGTFVERVKAARCRVAAWVMLTAARGIHGATVPADVVRLLRPSMLRRAWLGTLLTTRRFPMWRNRWMPMGLGRLLVMPALTDRVRDWPGIAWRYARVRLLDVVGRRRGRSGAVAAGWME